MGIDLGDIVRGGLALSTGGASEAALAGYNYLSGGGGVGDVANAVGLGKAPNVDALYADPNGFTYGGHPDYYYGFRNRMEAGENAAQGQANQDYQNSGLARAQMQSMADQYGRVAAGKAGPSLAEQQMRYGQHQAAQQAMQAAASTRGGTGAMLAAQRAAQTQGVLGQQDVAQQAAMLRSKEVQQARDAQAGLLGAMRQQDLSSRGQGQQQALGYVGAQHAATMGTLQGTMGYQQANMQADQWAKGINAGQDAAALERRRQFASGLLSSASSAAAMGAAGG